MSLYDFYWFIAVFIIIYLFYLMFSVLKRKKYDPNNCSVEAKYLIKVYKLDMKKINYRLFLNNIGLVSAFDISFTSTLVLYFIKNTYLAIFVCFLVLIPVILITFGLIGFIYKKKGLVKNAK